MKKYWIGLVLLIVLACNNDADKAPDVSTIKVNMQVERFEKDFFTIDTTNLEKGLNNLQVKYPSVTPVFIGGVLGLPPDNKIVKEEVARFIRMNASIYQTAERKY